MTTAGLRPEAPRAEPGQAVVTATAPGKLYVLGEYAVVEPGHRAVLVAVDRYVRVEAVARERDGLFCSSAAGAQGPLGWRHRATDAPLDASGEHLIEVEEDSSGFYRYLAAATRTVERLRAERGLPSRHYALSVASALDDAVSGAKFGLGSSAAVTVAAVGAVAAFYGMELSPEQVYRLAMLATVQVTAATSGGDLAASALGGWVLYASPDRTWLLEQLAAGSRIEDLLRTDWPGLLLDGVVGSGPASETMPVQLRVGWTGRPADTPELVGRMRSRAGIPADLLARSEAAVQCFLDAARGGQPETVGEAVAASRSFLADLAAQRGSVIETPELAELVRRSAAHGWWGKSSGAGGGDCGIALARTGADARALEESWEQAGIRPLGLDVSATGLQVTVTQHQDQAHHQDIPGPGRPDDPTPSARPADQEGAAR